MIKKILIANRGEIACRIIKTAHKLGIATVAVYSEADKQARHVGLADEAVYIGPAPSKESYLNIPRIMAAVSLTGADAVHPGYGFLSENGAFASTLAEHNIIFIGPPADAIKAMGSKSAAKQIMEAAGVPLVPGYHGDDQRDSYLQSVADKMGYPVLLKAAAGGGGKGMRQVWQAPDFPSALAAAKREALISFNDDIMLVEKYLTDPRHIEIQVFCDTQGNGVYLFERDCSIQRRHQKVIEEAPAPGMCDTLRQAMGEAALKAAHAIGYVGAGTVEFLLDSAGEFYFMEMNTRLQVEHPVTEMITGEDLVAWQIRVAQGECLPKTQQQLTCHGHAIEARIYAEDPAQDFLPATGTLHLYQPPKQSPHVRVDTGVMQGDGVSVYYDPMLAKLIVWGETRQEAVGRLLNALAAYYIDGVTTNIAFLHKVASSEPFVQAAINTSFIETHSSMLFARDAALPVGILPVMAWLALHGEGHMTSPPTGTVTPWSQNTGWRLNSEYLHTVKFIYDGHEYEFSVTLPRDQVGAGSATWHLRYQDHYWQISGRVQDHLLQVELDGHRQCFGWAMSQSHMTLFTEHGALVFAPVSADLGESDSQQGQTEFAAPMNGSVVAVMVEAGMKVRKGDTLLIMEAMKMEHNITAPCDGQIMDIFYQQGELVDGGATLLEFTADE
ncbi:acetyl/propionyl/methylcrotonyl-CoA carboxylase subunit alpha [Alteromonas sp. C1M14]|uniref:acetyl-CoA carboxylase biotin carboxylase subunit n=1 Tax=Alteromonas sp. C1M14 TaxID=2841567 RepID=UPI001C087E5F|nr:acetyl/propionyl/methylcrotonyl-CoA carboxylase subunit alpha [Alteromonas sp. C1M14]MBU2976681.1 acetyl/propionyl/methylcrotonyl-CoA carboxylase subunit alpha [Alteromonas sp. C1M14]